MGRVSIKKHLVLALLCAVICAAAVIAGVHKIQAEPDVIRVKNLSELEAALSGGDQKIVLDKDIEVKGYLLIDGDKTISIDLNGHKLKLDVNMTKRSSIRVHGGAKLIISNSGDEEEGQITGGYTLGGFGGGIQVSGGSLVLNSGWITNGTSRAGGGVALINGGTFEMNGGVIQKCYMEGIHIGRGGGVYVGTGCSFVMNGGIIRGNQEKTAWKNNGGGVYVEEGATFRMTGGKIGDHLVVNGANSISGNGAGVYVNGGEFIFEGGSVENNVTSASGAGIYLNDGSKFKMTGETEVFYNMVTDLGAAIYVKNASVEIEGTHIYRNTSGNICGGIYIDPSQASTMTIKNSVFDNNIGAVCAGAIYLAGGGLGLDNVTFKENMVNVENGGAITVDSNAVLQVNKGSFTKNSVLEGYGGAIYMMGGSTVKLSDVTITENEAVDGGAIYALADSTLCITNGSINKNKAKSSQDSSVFVAGGIKSEGKLKLGGAPVITGNKHCDSTGKKLVRTSNVLLAEYSYIDLIEPLSKDAEVGVWKEAADKRITSSYGDKSLDTWRTNPTYYFFSDNDDYYAQKNPDIKQGEDYFHEVYLMKPEHIHEMTLEPAVAATCVDEGCKEYYKCSECEHIFKDDAGEYEYSEQKNDNGIYFELVTSRDPKNHVGGCDETVKVIEEPDCTKAGENEVTRTCKSCKEVVEIVRRPVDALGHDLEAITEYNGVNGHGEKCTRCDYYWFVPDAVVGCNHLNLDEHEKVDPSCTEGGMKAYGVCQDCGAYVGYDEENSEYIRDHELTDDEIKELVLMPLGHDVITDEAGDAKWFVDDSTVIEPDCETDGLHDEYTECRRCQAHLEMRTIKDPALNHDLSDIYVENCRLMRKCLRDGCNVLIACGVCHDLVEVAKVDPKCTADGHEAVYACINCGQLIKYEDYHDFGMPINISYQDIVIDALGHKFGEWQILTEPTATTKGQEIHYCERCDAFEVRDMDVEVTYRFTKGDGSEWKNGSTGSLGFTVKRSYKDEDTFSKWFTGNIYVDGTLLTEDDATASEGSVNIDLKDSFLNTLEVGDHTITVEFEDAEVSAEFKVAEADTTEEKSEDTSEEKSEDTSEDKSEENTEEKKEADVTDTTEAPVDPKAPKTGDDSPVAGFMLLMAVSGAAMAGCLGLRSKKRYMAESDKTDEE
ncbi:hypothetical protein SAMN04487934_10677 [Eubacterium ruminantium]|nr:hypothetical protein SAMN04487934_10677 [Eubacterium ruminantium]